MRQQVITLFLQVIKRASAKVTRVVSPTSGSPVKESTTTILRVLSHQAN